MARVSLKEQDSRFYHALNGNKYLIPMGVHKREHGFTLSHQLADGKRRFYQFNASEFLNFDHAFQAAVSTVDFLLKHNLMMLNLQVAQDHVNINKTHITTYLYSSETGRFKLYRKGILRIKKHGYLNYYVMLVAEKRKASIDLYRADLRRSLPSVVEYPLYLNGKLFTPSSVLDADVFDYEIIKTPSGKARSWLKSNVVILDTETTGLGTEAEVIEVSIIDGNGKVLLDTLVKPVKSVPINATKIHGIDDSMLKNANTWPEIKEQFEQVIKGKTLLIYNADYDVRLLKQTYEQYGLSTKALNQAVSNAECVMLNYAEYYGEWDDYRDNWKWQKLTNAAKQCRIGITGAHRALADVQMTLGVIKHMAENPSRRTK